MFDDITLTLALQIVKGEVAAYALSCAHIRKISNVDLAVVLKEIAEELKKR